MLISFQKVGEFFSLLKVSELKKTEKNRYSNAVYLGGCVTYIAVRHLQLILYFTSYLVTNLKSLSMWEILFCTNSTIMMYKI